MATTRGSSITAALQTARPSTSGSGSTSRRFAPSRPAKSSCTTTGTSETAPRTRTGSGCTCASAARRRVAGRSWRRSRRARRNDRSVVTEHRTGVHSPAIRVLLADAIDYAGLFPPAQLDMSGAVAEYASYLQSADQWALGRFVVPAARLDELVAEGSALGRDEALG